MNEITAKIIMIFLYIIGIGIHLTKWDETDVNRYGGITFIICYIITFILYYYAGIFNILK